MPTKLNVLSWDQARDGLVNVIDTKPKFSLPVIWHAAQAIAGRWQQARGINFLVMPECERTAIRDFLVSLQ